MITLFTVQCICRFESQENLEHSGINLANSCVSYLRRAPNTTASASIVTSLMSNTVARGFSLRGRHYIQ